MLFTWILIFSLMVVYVQNYSGHTPPHLESPLKHVRREKQGNKEKLRISLQSSVLPNEETQTQRFLKSEFISSKKSAKQESVFINNINNLATEIVIEPKKSKSSSLVVKKTKGEVELHETKGEKFPNAVQDGKTRVDRDVFKKDPKNEINHSNSQARTDSPNFTTYTTTGQLDLVNGKQQK